MARRVLVAGAGMTVFRRRAERTGPELAAAAARDALDDAGLALADIDSVALAGAADAFDGVHRKGEWLAAGAGSAGRRLVRVAVSGGSGPMAVIAGWWHVASGLSDACLVVAEEQMSRVQPHPQAAFNKTWDPLLEQPFGVNQVGTFALEMQRYLEAHRIAPEDVAIVAVKNKRNAVDHPSAQLADPRITVADVLASEVVAWPVRRLGVSPPTDGASALVLVAEDLARARGLPAARDRVEVAGVGWCLDDARWPARDLAFPDYVAQAARQAYTMAGIGDPRREVHVAEPYDSFDYKECQHLEALGLCGRGEGASLAREGVTMRDGALPACPSGGLLGVGNPIAANMGVKVGEVYLQLAGKAGKRQVAREARTGVAQGWGGLMSVGTVVVLRRAA